MLMLQILAVNKIFIKFFNKIVDVFEKKDNCSNDTDIIDHLLYDTTVHYNRHKIPSDPVVVRIELWIQEVTSVSEMTQDFEIGFFNF